MAVILAFALFEQREKIGVLLREAGAGVRASAQRLRDQDFQRVQIVDQDVAVADAPAAIIVFVVKVWVQRRPKRAGDLVGNATQPPGMKLVLVGDTAVLA